MRKFFYLFIKGIFLFLVFLIFVSFSGTTYTTVYTGGYIQKNFPGVKDTIVGDSLIFHFNDYENYPSFFNVTSPLFLKNPSVINSFVKYDLNTGKFVFYDKIGDFNYRSPHYMSFEDFLKYNNKKGVHQYWMNRSALESVKGETSLVDRLVNQNLIVPIQGFDKIFGSNTINIKPQGTAELLFGLKINESDDPSLPKELRKSYTFDFDMNIKIGVNGQIGDKVKLGINFDTDATFEFENNVKLAYEGKEDEIIQRIEAGNVTMPLSGSLITGSHSLFGLKTELKFGNLFVTTVFSQQKGESKTIEVSGGATTTPFEIDADDYDENRHYFVSQYFRDKYNYALSNLPIIQSNIQIRKVEVWVTNRSGSYENSRDIIAFMDLGENETHMYATAPEFRIFDGDLPKNSTNRLYALITSTYSAVRTISNANTVFSGIENFNSGIDYDKVQNARMLSTSEYSVNENLGYISLNSKLNSDEVLAVAFEYINTTTGEIYQVGEFTGNGPAAPDALFLKLLKPTTLSTEIPTWDLMMKNVYTFNAYQVNSQDFMLDIMYRNDKTGTAINFIPAGNIDGIKLLEVLGLDNLNKRNEPGRDGFFDFIDKVTINASNGRIFFPVLEPFGSNLKEKITGGSTDPEINRIAEEYVFQELYDNTQSQAGQIAEKNKFYLSGVYRSSGGSEINLNAMNVPEGSVTVTAGGAQLVENQDYTVDYNLGRVTIIRQSLLESGTPIQISLESNSMFDVGTKSMLGTHFDYRVSDNFNVGATVMHLHQKPLTNKVSIGNEPISNTMWGTNINFNQEVPFLTKFVDKFIPFVKTKAPSRIDFTGEFAQLIPGHPKILGEDGYTHIDDFEGSKVTIDLKSFSNWKISSTPQGQPDLFPEAQFSDSLKYGYNRAKLAWYSVHRDFLSTSGSGYNYDVHDLSDHRVREIPEQEIFPNRDPQNDIPQFLHVLNLAYYPKEKGPYNFDTQESDISAGVESDGSLIEPESRWGGITRDINTNDFEEANIEFIEFWMLDPFLSYPETHQGGDIYFNLGNISEDILRDSRQAFENGLPTTDNIINVDTTSWGRVPILPRISNAFANEPEGARVNQDVGLDGLSSADEASFFNAYLQDLQSIGSAAFDNAKNDPSGDDYLSFGDPSYSGADLSILDRYKKFNNQEGNSYSSGDTATATERRPDMEDLNEDFTLSEHEAYFQYKVSIRPADMQIGRNYITDIKETNVKLRDETEEIVKWYHFKIPIDDYEKIVGPIEDFKSIRFVRLFMKNWEQEIVLRFAELDLVRGDWRKYKLSMFEGAEGSGNPEITDAQFDINTVNIEENASRQPVNYVLPPGVTREISPNNPYLRQLNEQSLSLKVINLDDGDSRGAYKNVSIDVRQFKTLQMFIHAEAIEGEIINDDDLCAFIRLGSDYKENYYEYEVPLKLTEHGYYSAETENELVWPTDNMIDIDFEVFQGLKQRRNDLILNGSIIQTANEYTEYIDESGRRISVTGSPNLSNVRTIMIGIRNRKRNKNILFDDGLPKSVEVWMNELRLSGFNEDGGWATRGRLQANLADFSSIALSGEYSTPGFGSIEKQVNDRQKSTEKSYEFSSSTEFGKFFPKKYGVRIPVYFGYSEIMSDPQYDPLNPDIKMTTVLKNMTQEERDNHLKISQDYTRRKTFNVTNFRINGNSEKKEKKKKTNEEGEKKKPKPKKTKQKNKPIYHISNWSTSYGFSETFISNINTDHNLLKIHTGALTYNYNITPKNVKPFAKVKLFRKKAFHLLRDFNFYYSPSMLAFRTDFRKSYNEIQQRNISDTSLILDETYDHQFSWNRSYDLKYNLSRNIKFTYSANNQAWIDEPYGKIEKTDAELWNHYKDSVMGNIKNFGRTTDFSQEFDVNWNTPINKIPLLGWTNVNARYRVSYFWTVGPKLENDLGDVIEPGNSIRNSSDLQISAQLNTEKLYKKVKFLKNVDNKFKGSKRKKTKKFKEIKFIKENVNLKKDKARSVIHNLKDDKVKVKVSDESGKEVKGKIEIISENKIKFYADRKVSDARVEVIGKKELKENIFKLLGNYSVYALMSVRNVSLNYTLNNTSRVPTYLPKTRFLGFDEFWNAPGWDFILGFNNEHYIENIAGPNGWISGDTLINEPFVFTTNESYDFRATLKPIHGMRIDVDATRKHGYHHVEQWSNTGSVDRIRQELEQGNFTVSVISIATSFDKYTDDFFNTPTYEKFRNSRRRIASRLAEDRFLSGFDSDYDPNSYNIDSIGNRINNFPNGYYDLSPDVLIPAFYAAYTGKHISKSKLDFLKIIPMPNWRLKFDGLTYFDLVRKVFKKVIVDHSYRSTFQVGTYQENSLFTEVDNTGYSSVRDDQFETFFVSRYDWSTVSLNESYLPLIGIHMTWYNDMTTKFEYKKTRNVILSLSNNSIAEEYVKEYTIGFGYKIPDLEIPLTIQGSQRLFKSDLNLRIDFSYYDKIVLMRRIQENINDLVPGGTNNIAIKFNADYNLDKITIRLFYDRNITKPKVSTAFPTSNTHIGFSLRFNLAAI